MRAYSLFGGPSSQPKSISIPTGCGARRLFPADDVGRGLVEANALLGIDSTDYYRVALRLLDA